MSYDGDVPFDHKGNQQHYPEVGWAGSYADGTGKTVPVAWAPNHIFEDTLTYKEYRRGRSAAYFVFTRTGGQQVTMFLKDFEQCLAHMVNGKITGKFTFCKRGQNYGCKRIEDENEETEISHSGSHRVTRGGRI